MPSRIARRACVIGLVASLCTLPGCLISSHSGEISTGTKVSSQTFSQIEPGVTTEAWIKGTLGAPTTKTTLEDGSELWKYTYTRTKHSNGSLLFIFKGSSHSSSGGSVYVQLKDGIVVKHWRTDE